jgi:hypothetical protein
MRDGNVAAVTEAFNETHAVQARVKREKRPVGAPAD